MTTATRTRYWDGARRRRAILRYLLERERVGLVPPQFREVQRAARLASTSSAEYHLRTLKRLGLITMAPGQARTVRLTPSGVLAAQGYRLLWRAEDL